MRPVLGSDQPAGTRPWLRLAAGPVLTLLFAATCEVLRPTPYQIPAPGVIVTLFVVWSSFVGGRAPGLLSAAIAATYLAWLNANSTSPLIWRGDNLTRVRVLWMTLPALAWMTGLLRERGLRAAARSLVDGELRALLEQSPSSVFLADASGRYLYANPRALDLTGYTLEELRGMTMADLVAPESPRENPLRLDELRQDRTGHVKRRIRRRDGTTFLADIAGRRLPDGRLLGDVRDVTAEYESTARLERTLSALRATLESTADGILVVDSSGRWQSWNQHFLRMWGFPPGMQAVGDFERTREDAAAQLTNPVAFLARVRELYADPEAESFDELLLGDGRIFERVSRPQRVGGECVGRVWSFRDVTESRQQANALRASERQLMQSQKLEALGRLAGGVAHDFNNMLTVILGETEMLLGELREGGEERAAVGRIHVAAERSARLTRQLLAFGRRRQQAAVELDLRQMVLEVEPIMRRLTGPARELRVWSPATSEALCVCAESMLLEQALLNLVVNATDAMPDGGVVDIRLFRETLTVADAARRGAPAAGDYACIEVGDSGPGIPPDIRPHLFEPFFTTKPPGKGTGLGLASVHGAVLDARGFIEVENKPGQGALFRLMLPALSAQSASAPPRAERVVPASSVAGEAPIVLLAEDEDAVRAFARTVLRREGFRVVDAANGAEALAAVDALPTPPALLLSDVRMPGFSGVELARRLRERLPDLPVLLISGWPGEVADEMEACGLRLRLLAKPFAGAELVAAVRAELAADKVRAG